MLSAIISLPLARYVEMLLNLIHCAYVTQQGATEWVFTPILIVSNDMSQMQIFSTACGLALIFKYYGEKSIVFL